MSRLLYLVDTFSLVFQVYHAISEMTGPKGQPTNAVFGFTRDLQFLIEQQQPTHLICAMDSIGPGVRNEMYAAYKANRKEIPQDLEPQIPMILEVIEGFRVPAIGCPGWEADDVIATLARRASQQGYDVCIVTSDKDARQLLSGRVKLYNVRKQNFFDEAALREQWGIRPDQVIDFQALVGDPVDNVPGVPLVGPKKAQTLLDQFGTLDEVLAHADEVRGNKLRANLREFAEQARVSKELVTLNSQLPLDFDFDQARIHEPDRQRLLQIFTDLGFRRFAEAMRDSGDTDAAAPVTQPAWEIVDTEQKFSGFVKDLKKQRRFCVDLETTSLNAIEADIVGWAVCWDTSRSFYIPVDGPRGQAVLDAAAVREAFRGPLEDPEIEIVNQNIKYDMLVLRRAGVRLQGVSMDPMVGDYLLDAGARSHGLDRLAEKYLQHRMIPISDLIGSGKQQKKMFEVDVDKAAEYAAEDAAVAWRIANIVAEELKQAGLWELYWHLERPLIPVLVDMEFTGIRVDVDELKRQSEELSKRLDELVGEIHKEAGHEFNIDSPLQLRVVLFKELKLPVIKRTKTGASTSQDVLEKLAPMHPLPALIIEHRHLSKLKNTYLDSLPAMVNRETGRIHASFNQVVAATGRLSASDPNLQNIPIRSEEGRRVRKAFLPGSDDWKLVCADYSQIELRMLAHFSGDEALRSAFREGVDIHAAVAAEIFEVEPEKVDREMRRVAKAVNFGVIYGQSPFGLAAALGIGQEKAAEFIDGYFSRYSGVDRYLEDLLRECARTGFAKTILGRRRPITGVRPEPHPERQRNLAERTAINTAVQGSAADLIKQAMINAHARLQRERHPGRILLQIHDELVLETPEEETDSLIDIVRHEMEGSLELSVPLVVDVAVGENWYNVQPV